MFKGEFKIVYQLKVFLSAVSAYNVVERIVKIDNIQQLCDVLLIVQKRFTVKKLFVVKIMFL